MPKFHPLTSYVQDRKKTVQYFPSSIVSHISTVSDTVLQDVQFPPYRSCEMLFDTVFHLHPLHHSREVFLYILQHIQHMVQHNTGHTRPTICVHKLFVVDHCIRLRNTMAIVKDRSHINQTPSITLVYYFLINSPDQDLHHSSRFRVYVFLLDIFSRTICSFIYYVQFYHSRACNTCKAEAVKP